MTTVPQKITFGEMCESGVRDVLIYCRDHHCRHHVETNADGWADDVRLFYIEPNLTCTRCGKRGAEVRPAYRQGRLHPGAWLTLSGSPFPRLAT